MVLPPGVDGRRFREYGFVHYTERACALKAIEAAEEEKPTLDKKELTVGPSTRFLAYFLQFSLL